MKSLDRQSVSDYLNARMPTYYQGLNESLNSLTLDQLLQGDFYQIRTNNTCVASKLLLSLLDTFLLPFEENGFQELLTDLAIFVAEQTSGGHKSASQGIDLEFINNDIHYVVSIKSGTNWGNSSQQNKLEQDLKDAIKRLKQTHHAVNVQPVLGICYGKTRTSYMRGYMKVVGQNFWYMISEDKDLYTEIVEPIGYRAREHNDSYLLEKAKITNRFTGELIDRFCDPGGAINWTKLVEFSCGNFDLDQPQKNPLIG